MTPPNSFDRLRAGLVDGVDTFERGRKKRRQLATGGVIAAVVLTLVGGFLLLRDDDAQQTVVADDGTSEDTIQDDTDTDDGGVDNDTELMTSSGRAPRGFLPDDAFLVDDTTVLFWGYFDQFDAIGATVGYSLDLETGRLTELPPPARPVVGGRAVAWTGEEMIICCGSIAPQAYNPTTDTWRELPPTASVAGEASGEWTGTELFLVGDGTALDVYDPMQDAWGSVPAPAPLAVQFPRYDTAWAPVTGDRAERLFVWPTPAQRTAHNGWVYDTADLSWSELPPIPGDLAPAMVSIEWAEDRLIVGGGLPAANAGTSERFVLWQLVDGSDAWEAIHLDVGEPDPCECNLGSQTLLWTGDELLVHLGALGSGVSPDGVVWLVDPATGNSDLLATDPYALEPIIDVGDLVLWKDQEAEVFLGSARLPNEMELADTGGAVAPVETEPTPGSEQPEETPEELPEEDVCFAATELAELGPGTRDWQELLELMTDLIPEADIAEALERYLAFAAEETAPPPGDILDDLVTVDDWMAENCSDHQTFVDAVTAGSAPAEEVTTQRIRIPAGALPSGFTTVASPEGGTSETHHVQVGGTTEQLTVTTFHDLSFNWSEFGTEGQQGVDTYFTVNGNPAVAFDGAEGLLAPGEGWSLQWGQGSEYGVLVFTSIADLDRVRGLIDELTFGAAGLEVDQLSTGLLASPVRSMLTGFWPVDRSPAPGDETVVLQQGSDVDRPIGLTVSGGPIAAQIAVLEMLGGGVVEIVPVVGPADQTRDVRFATAGLDDGFAFTMATWQEGPDVVVTMWAFDPAVDLLDLAAAIEIS